MALRTRILHDIYQERIRQDIKWGGPEHDAHHTPEEWRQLIKDRCDRLPLSPADDRRLFVEIAAIAAAAIEAHDLREPRDAE